MATGKEYIDSNKDRFLEELFNLLRIPSVSTDPDHKKDMAICANAVKEAMMAAGVDKAEVCPTNGHPLVYGEKIIDKALPTILVYGHYDVQPPAPMDLWKSEPFNPEIRDGNIYARGACDDKGQMFMHIKALEVMNKTNSLSCNVKMMIEGEEEVGSPNLGAFVKDNKEKLAADIVLISDTAMLSMENPSIEAGLRGMTYMQIDLTGPNRDLHSGVYGGAVANPINQLCDLIAALKDDNKHITIPGFYDKVEEMSDEERKNLNKAPFDEAEYKTDLGVNELVGEKGYTTLERTGIRPTLDVNGIWGGYTKKGAKTVLPSEAHAKISMRLVPHQDSDEIADLFEKYLQGLTPAGTSIEISKVHGATPVVTPTDSKAYKAAAKAIVKTFGKEPIPTRGGGSIPIVALFEEVLGLKAVLLGFGLDSDNIHSPNEKYGVFNFFKGIETIPYFYQYFAES